MITRPPTKLTREDDERDLAFLDLLAEGRSIRTAAVLACIPHNRARRLFNEYWTGEPEHV